MQLCSRIHACHSPLYFFHAEYKSKQVSIWFEHNEIELFLCPNAATTFHHFPIDGIGITFVEANHAFVDERSAEKRGRDDRVCTVSSYSTLLFCPFWFDPCVLISVGGLDSSGDSFSPTKRDSYLARPMIRGREEWATYVMRLPWLTTADLLVLNNFWHHGATSRFIWSMGIQNTLEARRFCIFLFNYSNLLSAFTIYFDFLVYTSIYNKITKIVHLAKECCIHKWDSTSKYQNRMCINIIILLMGLFAYMYVTCMFNRMWPVHCMCFSTSTQRQRIARKKYAHRFRTHKLR